MGKLRYIFSSPNPGRPYFRGPFIKYRMDNNAFVVFDDTKIVCACETERFTKNKHDFRLPTSAKYAFFASLHKDNDVDIDYIPNDIIPYEHHDAHIYESFYQSGFHEAAVMVNDGFGDRGECLTLAYMQEGNAPVILKKFKKDDSPCVAYSTASSMIFDSDFAEGKFMGLAGYGKNNGRKYIAWNAEENKIETNPDILESDIKAIKAVKKDIMQYKDIAFTVQHNFEEVLLEVVRYFKKLLEEAGYQTENFCLSGGGVLNCPTNSKIVGLGLFKHFYASPQPSDGCAESIGRAFITIEATQENKIVSKRLDTPYLGLCYTKDFFESPVRPVLYMNKNVSVLCDHLENGGVIAWFQDGAEYGPRALGHRSFLADPCKKEMLDSLNKIKARENWRPLAPIVPEELFTRVFDVDNTDMCEFMLRTLTIKEGWRERLQAVCHVDGTTRPQLLKKDLNPELYALVMEYFKKTHTPCLINTSLNINGFPIVETPQDFYDMCEEIAFLKNIPPLKPIYIENGSFYEVHVKHLKEMPEQSWTY